VVVLSWKDNTHALAIGPVEMATSLLLRRKRSGSAKLHALSLRRFRGDKD
jgi:hypothetical protein